ncbi:alpha/beta fold hydrolase [Nocardia sp. NPDC060256]|uniref:alpha/beta fold hydrolase n=1 Tax=unclassified Nocardia TaxID=2637762 RepID=UPI0036462747
MTSSSSYRGVLLVHGAWHTGKAWDGVAAGLRARGVPVAVAELHRGSLAADIAAAEAALDEILEFGPAIVCGHSYGGAIISGLPAEKIAHLVYLAAVMPDLGESALGLLASGPAGELSAAMVGDILGTVTLDPERAGMLLHAHLDEEQRAAHVAELVPQDMAAGHETATSAVWRSRPSTYVVCSDDRAMDPVLQRRFADHATHTLTWNSDHGVMASHETDTVELLSRLAAATPESLLAGNPARINKADRTSHILVLGGGIVGLTAAMLLARDGHRVTVLDKDAGSAGSEPESAWEQWRRPGVNQFRHPHLMLPSGYHLLVRELPDAVEALTASGARPHNMLDGTYKVAAIGGRVPGDERFDTLAARRPVIEEGLGAAAARTPGLTIRRGTPVTGLLTDGAAGGVPRVVGVLTGHGEEIRADLIIDALGRNSPTSKLLTDIGATEPAQQRQETGFLAYSRYFRSTDGSLPAQPAWPLEHHDSLTMITIPGDAGTWAVALFVAGRDRALRALSEPATWQRAAALYPDMAHWASAGEPITGVLAMSGIEAKHRSLVVDGRPVVTGLVSVGDAWATTNPIFGMGITMGMFHAELLRDVVRELDIDDKEKLALRFDEVTDAKLEPVYQAVAEWDHHRLAQIDGDIAGVPYETDHPGWNLRQAMEAAKLKDPEVMRGFSDIGSMLRGADEVLATPGLQDRIIELGAGAARYPESGPSRAELLAVVGAE